jgi:hypothetical protein
LAYLNPEESLRRDKETLGDDLGELYNVLKNVMLFIQTKMQMYDMLYNSESKVSLLNDFSSEFFGKLQDILFDDIIISICKLFSKPETSSKKNLCFGCLPEMIQDKDLKEKIVKVIEECNEKIKNSTKTRRDKYIAHFDYDFFLEKIDYDISVKWEDVKIISDKMWLIVNIIENYYYNASCISKVYSQNLGIEMLFQKIRCINKIGLKKAFEILNQEISVS